MSDQRNHQEPVYRVPDGLRVYAVGDVHGCLDHLKRMHEAISMDLLEEPPEDVHIVYLGDYVDKGVDSRGVLDYLVERKFRRDGIQKTFLMGNHEVYTVDCMRDPEGPWGDSWLHWGGIATLKSYGIKFEGDVLLPAEKALAFRRLRDVMSQDHLEFLDALHLYVEIGDYLFVHAGIHPDKAMAEQKVEDFTFVREPFLSWHKDPLYKPFPRKVVHGHTIAEQPEVLPHRIGVDTGAYTDEGTLTAVVLEKDRVRFLQV